VNIIALSERDFKAKGYYLKRNV